MGGGGKHGVSPIILGSDTDGPAVWIRVLGAVRCDDEGSGGHPCGVPLPDHREAGDTIGQREVGDTGI